MAHAHAREWTWLTNIFTYGKVIKIDTLKLIETASIQTTAVTLATPRFSQSYIVSGPVDFVLGDLPVAVGDKWWVTHGDKIWKRTQGESGKLAGSQKQHPPDTRRLPVVCLKSRTKWNSGDTSLKVIRSLKWKNERMDFVLLTERFRYWKPLIKTAETVC